MARPSTVYATDASGVGGDDSVNGAVRPQTPTGLSGKAVCIHLLTDPPNSPCRNRGAQLSWTPVAGAAAYNIYARGLIAQVGGAGSSYQRLGLPLGTCSYSITAVGPDNVESARAAAVTVTVSQ